MSLDQTRFDKTGALLGAIPAVTIHPGGVGYPSRMSFESLVGYIGDGMELGGIVVIVVGTAASLVRLVGSWWPGGTRGWAYARTRRAVGRSILLGLELLVAGDIIRTVAVSPTFTSIGVLAGVVLIRTFLSFTLELEISGRWPWQQQDSPTV